MRKGVGHEEGEHELAGAEGEGVRRCDRVRRGVGGEEGKRGE